MRYLKKDAEGITVCTGFSQESATERRERLEQGVESDALHLRRFQAIHSNEVKVQDMHRFIGRLRGQTDLWPKGTPRKKGAHCKMEGILSLGGSLDDNRESSLSRIISGSSVVAQPLQRTLMAVDSPKMGLPSAADLARMDALAAESDAFYNQRPRKDNALGRIG